MWRSPEDEHVPVYTSRIRITVEVALGTRQDLKPVYDESGILRFEGIVSLQACDESMCWPPTEIAVEWVLHLIPPDLERPPEDLQRERLSLKPTTSS